MAGGGGSGMIVQPMEPAGYPQTAPAAPQTPVSSQAPVVPQAPVVSQTPWAYQAPGGYQISLEGYPPLHSEPVPRTGTFGGFTDARGNLLPMGSYSKLAQQMPGRTPSQYLDPGPAYRSPFQAPWVQNLIRSGGGGVFSHGFPRPPSASPIMTQRRVF